MLDPHTNLAARPRDATAHSGYHAGYWEDRHRELIGVGIDALHLYRAYLNQLLVQCNRVTRVLAKGQTPAIVRWRARRQYGGPGDRGTQSYGSHETAGLPTSVRLPGYRTSWFGFFIIQGMMMRNQRGMVLGIVIPTAIVCAIAAYAVLQASVSEARHAKFMKGRVGARYLSEAALVIAKEKLWNEATTPYPPGCAAGGTMTTTESVDTNGDGVGDTNVSVTVTNCGSGNPHTITAAYTY